MHEAKFKAKLVGDEIVIRIPFEKLQESMADQEIWSSLTYPVTVERKAAFLADLVASMNRINAVESMITCEVGAMVEDGSKTVKEHGLPKLWSAA